MKLLSNIEATLPQRSKFDFVRSKLRRGFEFDVAISNFATTLSI